MLYHHRPSGQKFFWRSKTDADHEVLADLVVRYTDLKQGDKVFLGADADTPGDRRLIVEADVGGLVCREDQGLLIALFMECPFFFPGTTAGR